MNKTISIGRDSSCSIQIGENYDGVSRRHASISKEGNRFVLKDSSTNGCYVNGRKINNEQVEIRNGDTIYLGKDYLLQWSRINSFFSDDRDNYRASRQTERRTIPHRDYVEQSEPVYIPRYENSSNSNSKDELEKELKKWNWGAFGLYTIWGFANGMWWLILIGIISSWLFPLVNIIMGIKGSQWAWEYKEWRDLEHFKQVQKSWKPWGIAITILNILPLFFLLFMLVNILL